MVGGGGIEFEHLFDQPTIEPERRGLRPSGARAPLDETLSGQPREPSAPLTALARSFRDPVLRWCALLVPEFLPQPLEAALGEVRASADRDHGGLPAAERAAWLSGLRQLVDATEAVFTQVLEPFDAHGDGDTLHAARSTGSWLQGALRLAPGDAAQRVRIARRASGALAEPVTALTTGSLTFDQVRAIERAVRSLPLETEVASVDLLVDLAGRVDAGRLRVAGRAMRYAVDPDGALVDAQTQFDRRYLHLSPLLDGMTAVDGLLDAESTVVLAAALAPFLVPSDPDDERSTAQRRADGLIDVVRAAAATGDLPVLSGAPPTLEVVVPFDALVGAPGAAPGVVRGSPRRRRAAHERRGRAAGLRCRRPPRPSRPGLAAARRRAGATTVHPPSAPRVGDSRRGLPIPWMRATLRLHRRSPSGLVVERRIDRPRQRCPLVSTSPSRRA